MTEILFTFPDGTVVTAESMVADYSSDVGHLIGSLEISPEGLLVYVIAKCGIGISGPVFFENDGAAWEKCRQRLCPNCYPE